RHLDDRDLAAKRRVHAAQLETDVAAADDEQRLWNRGQIERSRRVPHARTLERERRNLDWARPGCQHRVLEPHVLLAAVLERHTQVVRIDDLGHAPKVHDLAVLGQLAGAVRQSSDHRLLESPELIEIDLRLAEADAPRFRMPRVADDVRDVEQRLRGNASAIDADAAGVGFGIDEGDVEPEIGGEKRRRISSRTSTDYGQLRRRHRRTTWAF